MEIVDHPFSPGDLVAGHLALDLVNTVTARNGNPRDWLSGYATLREWAALTGSFAQGDLVRLAALAETEPAEAEAALRRLKDLREALHRIVSRRLQEGAPDPQDLRRLQGHWKAAAAAATLSPRPVWRAEISGLDLVRHRSAWEAVDLLESQDPARVRVCDGPDCGWLFVDTSKNNRRRWCDMKDCGNVAKARRHLAKLRTQGT